MSKRFVRLVTLVIITAGSISLAQPAFALSNAPDKTWGTNGKVYALAQSSHTLFVGGSFTRAIPPNGQQVTVSNVAAFDLASGAYIPTFTASVQNTVATTKPQVGALAVSSDGSTLYIGGDFDTVDGQPRSNFAAVDTATGTQLSSTVNLSVDKAVNAILASPSLVYFGGNFKKVDGIPRQHLAAISAAGTLSSVWTPTTAAGTDPCPSQLPPGTDCGPTSDGGTGNVHSLALAPDGNSIYVGGNFYYVNGTPRNCLARVSATNGSTLNWAVPWSTIPSESTSDPYRGPNAVWTVLPTSTRVYIGWGRTPNGAEAYTTSTDSSGYVTSLWTQGAPGNAVSLALSADGLRLYVGGHFGTAVLDFQITSCGSNVWAHGLFSVNPSTGAYYCDWIPQMIPFGGQSAPGSGVNPPNYVGGWAMLLTSDALFVGGYFTSISGVTQSGFARFSLATPPPSISGFSPTSGPVGTSVTITGSDFTGATDVAFNGTAASFIVDSGTQITATVPSGATTGPISVTTPDGQATSSSSFTVTSSGPIQRVGRIGTVQNTSGTTQNSLSLAVEGTVAQGDTVVVGIGAPDKVTVSSVTDSRGNTYHVDRVQQYTSKPGAKSTTAIVTAPVTTALQSGDTITVTLDKGGAWGFVAEDWLGIAGLDQTGGADSHGSASSAVSVSTSGTTTSSPEAVFAVTTTSPWPGIAAGSGYIQTADLKLAMGTDKREFGLEYAIVSSTGTQTATFALGSAKNWVAAIGTYH